MWKFIKRDGFKAGILNSEKWNNEQNWNKNEQIHYHRRLLSDERSRLEPRSRLGDRLLCLSRLRSRLSSRSLRSLSLSSSLKVEFGDKTHEIYLSRLFSRSRSLSFLSSLLSFFFLSLFLSFFLSLFMLSSSFWVTSDRSFWRYSSTLRRFMHKNEC